MICTLRVKLPMIRSECVRLIEIKSNATFLELHEAIQDAVGFANDHLFDFYVGRHPDHRAYSKVESRTGIILIRQSSITTNTYQMFGRFL